MRSNLSSRDGTEISVRSGQGRRAARERKAWEISRADARVGGEREPGFGDPVGFGDTCERGRVERGHVGDEPAQRALVVAIGRRGGRPPEPSTWAQTTTPGPSSAVSSRAAERASAARISGAATTRLCESRAKAASHIPTRANSPLNPCRFRSPARRNASPPVPPSPRLAGRVIKSTRARRALPCEASSSHLLRKCSQSVRMQHVPAVPRARDAAQILRGLERRGRRPNLLKKLVDRIYRIC